MRVLSKLLLSSCVIISGLLLSEVLAFKSVAPIYMKRPRKGPDHIAPLPDDFSHSVWEIQEGEEYTVNSGPYIVENFDK
jgi:hypothetical protein